MLPLLNAAAHRHSTRETKRDGKAPETETGMAGRGLIKVGLLASLILAAVALIGIQGGCAPPSVPLGEETAIAELLTVDPEVVLTLTAWPSPPPLITQAPTPTAAPRALWTAASSPTVSPSVTPPSPTPPPQAKATSIPAAPPGSKPPAVRLLVPRLGLDVPVVEVSWDVVYDGETWRSVWQTADGAAGHHRNSANPGEAGNVVISGHHNTRGEVFRQVSEIGLPGSGFAVGDQVVLVAQDGLRYSYTVVDWDRFEESAVPQVRRDHARYLDPTIDATLTLVTCWPYDANSYRVVVIAKLQP
jgi:LPXTG-site transpeptidase (sortase) family protein